MASKNDEITVCDRCKALEEENKLLRIKVKNLLNKLSRKNREVNKLHKYNYESVDLDNVYDR